MLRHLVELSVIKTAYWSDVFVTYELDGVVKYLPNRIKLTIPNFTFWDVLDIQLISDLQQCISINWRYDKVCIKSQIPFSWLLPFGIEKNQALLISLMYYLSKQVSWTSFWYRVNAVTPSTRTEFTLSRSELLHPPQRSRNIDIMFGCLRNATT